MAPRLCPVAGCLDPPPVRAVFCRLHWREFQEARARRMRDWLGVPVPNVRIPQRCVAVPIEDDLAHMTAAIAAQPDIQYTDDWEGAD